MRTYEERREEERKYEADIFYEVWRSHGNPDEIDYDRVRDNWYNGYSSEDSARVELQSQKRQPQEQEEE